VAASPTQRTLIECRRRSWPAAVVERWNAFARIRQDLFGGIDLVVLDDSPGVLGIQATSDANVAARVTKLTGLIADGPLRRWLERGNRIQVWGWKKIGHRWHVRRIELDLSSARAL